MTSIICALLTAIGYYFSINLGEQWWLAWLAPIPILWLAFGQAPRWKVFLAAWLAYALGSSSMLRAYGGTLPALVMAEALLGPSLLFAGAVMAGRRLYRTHGPFAGMLAFACVFCALDFLVGFNQGGGAAQSPALSLVGAPALMQLAAFFGYPVLTFLIGFIPAGIAASVTSGRRAPAVVALVLFALNAGFGYWRILTPPETTMRVALIDSDDVMGKIHSADRDAALKAIDAYVNAMDGLANQQVQLVVLPENIAQIAPEWRDEAEGRLAAVATKLHATLVAGFNTTVGSASRNVSWAFDPGVSEPLVYEKRRLVPVLETKLYTPGPGPKVMENGIGLEICKDMDFPVMQRADAVATHPKLLAVPAWDFVKDDFAHARPAVLRSVENGVPMARSARNGLLTLNDRYGRIVTKVRTVDGFSVVVGELPLAGRGGNTVYDRIGDVFGWGSVILALGLMLASRMRERKKKPQASREA